MYLRHFCILNDFSKEVKFKNLLSTHLICNVFISKSLINLNELTLTLSFKKISKYKKKIFEHGDQKCKIRKIRDQSFF